MDTSMMRNPKQRTACDKCYKLKERCERSEITAACSRCQRLGLVCATVRPVRPVGRRVVRHETSPLSRGNGRKREDVQHQNRLNGHSCLVMLPDQQSEEEELLSFLLDEPESMRHYVLCPSFQAEQQQSLVNHLSSFRPFIKDALLACAIVLRQLQSEASTGTDSSASVSHISKAMIALRSLPMLSSHDVIICHALGSMLAFAIYSAIGVGVPQISSHCLGVTSSFLETTLSDGYKDPWQSFLVLLEIMDCIVYQKRPTLRIQMLASGGVVDCRLGLCLPLLPYYHDLCVISNSLSNTNDMALVGCVEKQLDDVRRAVELWQPSHLDQLIERFDSAEIVHLLAQAKLYRLGALLLAHRLQFPFGQEDVQANIWSTEIMMELGMTKQITKRPIRFVTLPFIVAAVEVQDQNLRIKTLQHVDDWVDNFAPFLQKATRMFLSRVWRERDLNPTCSWFKSIHKPCPVLDSLGVPCVSNA